MIIQTILYSASFLIGVFVVWYLGRKEHYDEEKLIDLPIIATAVSLVIARIGYFFTAPGRESFEEIRQLPNLWLMILSFFQLGNGSLWWIGIFVFTVVVIIILSIWRWPLWPVGGLVVLGGATSLIFFEVASLPSGLHVGARILFTSVLIALLVSYLLFVKEGNVIINFIAGVKKGYRDKMKAIKEKRAKES